KRTRGDTEMRGRSDLPLTPSPSPGTSRTALFMVRIRVSPLTSVIVVRKQCYLESAAHLFYANRLRTLGPLFNFEADSVAFLQTLESRAFYGAMVDKIFFPGIIRDKPIALLIVEPFYFTLHRPKSLLAIIFLKTQNKRNI